MRRSSAAFFLGDPAFLSDPKFRALARRLPDPDDFNSAVGAYWIALAAARRNGRRELDVDLETGSKFLPHLREVGLLEEDGFRSGSFETWAPKSPQVVAGEARASSGKRSEKGTFLPSSDTSALDTLGGLVQPYLTVPSNTVKATEGGPGETDPSWLTAWLSVKMRMPTERQRVVLDSYLSAFDVSGSERAERLILANPADPLGAIIADLRDFREKRKAGAEVDEAEAGTRRQTQRRGFRPGSVEAELAALLYAKQAKA